jgi:hypothetical protein
MTPAAAAVAAGVIGRAHGHQTGPGQHALREQCPQRPLYGHESDGAAARPVFERGRFMAHPLHVGDDLEHELGAVTAPDGDYESRTRSGKRRADRNE